jgi:hypothetical protein
MNNHGPSNATILKKAETVLDRERVLHVTVWVFNRGGMGMSKRLVFTGSRRNTVVNYGLLKRCEL